GGQRLSRLPVSIKDGLAARQTSIRWATICWRSRSSNNNHLPPCQKSNGRYEPAPTGPYRPARAGSASPGDGDRGCHLPLSRSAGSVLAFQPAGGGGTTFWAIRTEWGRQN